MLQIRRRPLLHSADGTVPVGFVPSHRQRRKRKTVPETQDTPHHQDEGPPWPTKARRLDPDKLRQAEAEFRQNAAQNFQCFMDRLFKQLPFVFCYLDDLIIASHTVEEHHEHLRQIFTILQKNGLQINPAKCVFAVAAVEFLGHRVDQHGVQPLQRHVQAISEFPPQFLGMVNFYRRFLPGIAPMLQPLTNALRGDPKTLEWPPAAAAFEALEAAVPLAHPARTLCSPWQQTPPTHT